VPSAKEPSFDLTLRVAITTAHRTTHQKMPKRSAEDESEWAKHKDSILKLYVEQDASLSEVIRAMSRQGFTRT
jgi:CBS domain-containing protein